MPIDRNFSDKDSEESDDEFDTNADTSTVFSRGHDNEFNASDLLPIPTSNSRFCCLQQSFNITAVAQEQKNTHDKKSHIKCSRQ